MRIRIQEEKLTRIRILSPDSEVLFLWRVGQCAACLKEKKIGSRSTGGGITQADIKSLGKHMDHLVYLLCFVNLAHKKVNFLSYCEQVAILLAEEFWKFKV